MYFLHSDKLHKNTSVIVSTVLKFSLNAAALNTLGGVSCVVLLPLNSQEWALVEYACNDQLPNKIHCLIKPVDPTDCLCVSFCSSFCDSLWDGGIDQGQGFL